MTNGNDPVGFSLEGESGYGNSVRIDSSNGVPQWINFKPGLTKREFFSIMILQGYMSGQRPLSETYYVRQSVFIADELIKTLNETENRP